MVSQEVSLSGLQGAEDRLDERLGHIETQHGQQEPTVEQVGGGAYFRDTATAEGTDGGSDELSDGIVAGLFQLFSGQVLLAGVWYSHRREEVRDRQLVYGWQTYRLSL